MGVVVPETPLKESLNDSEIMRLRLFMLVACSEANNSQTS